MMQPHAPQQPSLPPASQPPYDPSVERMKILRGIIIDLAIVGAAAAFVLTKAADASGAMVLLAAIAGAGAVHKGGTGLAGKIGTGSVVLALLNGLVGRGSDA